MYRILLLDGDTVTFETVRKTLSGGGCDVAWASTAREGLLQLEQQGANVVLVNSSLPDMAGLEALHRVRRSAPGSACVLLSDPGNRSVVVEAVRLGACDYIEKPLTSRVLLEIMASIRARAERGHAVDEPELHSLRRWAESVVRLVHSRGDARTIREWGHAVGVSAGGLRNWCRTARQSARNSLLFARVLRAVIRGSARHVAAEDLLNIVDRRTLVKLLAISGGTGLHLPADVNEFLERQRLIEDPDALSAVRALLEGKSSVQ